jgi:hypothetical protein
MGRWTVPAALYSQARLRAENRSSVAANSSMSSASTSAISTSIGHTEVSSSDRRVAAAESILHPRPELGRLKSGGATFSAGYSTSTNSQRDRVCAPHALQPSATA